MPAKFQVPLFYNFDNRYWTASVSATAEQVEEIDPIPHYSTVDFDVTFCAGGVATTLTAPDWTGGIKVKDDFSGTYLVQLSNPTLVGTVYTFTMLIDSTELRTALLSPQNQYAFEIHEATSGISTLVPIFFSISRSYALTGASPTSATGTLVVAATKTVSFPLSLTFPSSDGTNGFSLTYSSNNVLTWASSGALSDGNKGDITVSGSAGTWTINAGVVTLAKMADINASGGIKVLGRSTLSNGVPQVLSTSGTGSVAMTNGASLTNCTLSGAQILGSFGNVSLQSNSTGLRDVFFPDVAGGTVAVAATTTTATHALFGTTTAGAPAYRAIAAGDLPATLTSGTAITNAALTTPVLGTPSSGTLTNCTGLPVSGITASTTLALGVGSIELGHATANTLTASSGVLSIEGKTVLDQTNTLAGITNKTFVAPVLGAATATSINGVAITATGSRTLTMADDITIAAGGYITTATGGYIRTSGSGFIDTIGGGSIATGTGDLTGPNTSGTIALTTDITGGTRAGSFTSGTFSTTLVVTGALTMSAVPRFNGTNTSGAGTPLLGANSPAVTNSAPFTWFQVTTSDGSTGYIPVWK